MEKPFGAWRGGLVEQRRDNTFSYLHPCTRKPGHCSPHAWHGWPRSGSSNSGSWCETERQEINHQNCNSIHVTIPNVPSMAPPYSSYLTAKLRSTCQHDQYTFTSRNHTQDQFELVSTQPVSTQPGGIHWCSPTPTVPVVSIHRWGCINGINLKVPAGSQSHCSPIPT